MSIFKKRQIKGTAQKNKSFLLRQDPPWVEGALNCAGIVLHQI